MYRNIRVVHELAYLMRKWSDLKTSAQKVRRTVDIAMRTYRNARHRVSSVWYWLTR